MAYSETWSASQIIGILTTTFYTHTCQRSTFSGNKIVIPGRCRSEMLKKLHTAHQGFQHSKQGCDC